MLNIADFLMFSGCFGKGRVYVTTTPLITEVRTNTLADTRTRERVKNDVTCGANSREQYLENFCWFFVGMHSFRGVVRLNDVFDGCSVNGFRYTA
jgi:hypothetical protein